MQKIVSRFRAVVWGAEDGIMRRAVPKIRGKAAVKRHKRARMRLLVAAGTVVARGRYAR